MVTFVVAKYCFYPCICVDEAVGACLCFRPWLQHRGCHWCEEAGGVADTPGHLSRESLSVLHRLVSSLPWNIQGANTAWTNCGEFIQYKDGHCFQNIILKNETIGWRNWRKQDFHNSCSIISDRQSFNMRNFYYLQATSILFYSSYAPLYLFLFCNCFCSDSGTSYTVTWLCGGSAWVY